MKITKKTFGILSNGKKVDLYTLKAGDLRLSLSNLGATWTSLMLPARRGGQTDVLLGFAGCDGYLHNKAYFGATVGRFANRIGGGAFKLEGKTYRLGKNDGGNTLHSGFRGFDKILWGAEAFEENGGVYVRFELESPDGDGGFPGNLRAAVTYGVTKSNQITAAYEAKADEPTPVNITNHSYFNLAGEGAGSVLGHELRLFSSSYVEIDKQLIPTGRLIPVHDSPFDFRSRKPIAEEYDHCFTVDGDTGKLRPCAEVYEAVSGRTMKLSTTQPGLQFYTGNNLYDIPGKAGSLYGKYSGFCLETEHFPDSPNQNDFPSCIFGPGNDYSEKSVFSFEFD
jgi:aldose 1-epimerase